jgi:23S rRNA pseudouridine955/2504/2580 synthase
VETLMKNHQLTKRYRCLVRGEPLAGERVQAEDRAKFWQIEAFLEKRARQSEVFIHDIAQPGDLPVVTRYRILRSWPNVGPAGDALSELEVELVTGRTHQIRAHLAHLGHPLLGDGKYGRNSFNRHFRGHNGPPVRQQLWACSLIFSPDIKKGPLADLAGRTFTIEPDYDFDPDNLDQ